MFLMPSLMIIIQNCVSRAALHGSFIHTITCRKRTNMISSFSTIIIRVYCAIFLWWLRGKTPVLISALKLD